MIIKAIEDGIIFQFVEDTMGGGFENATNWGFVIQNKTEDVKQPRWGKVLEVGPKVKHVSVGQYIFIEKLMWTTALTIENYDTKFWKTNESHVLCTSDSFPEF